MEVNGVEFEEEDVPMRRTFVRAKEETLSEWLIRTKVAKSPIQANYVLLIVIVVGLSISAYAFSISHRKPVGPTPQQLIQFSHMGPVN